MNRRERLRRLRRLAELRQTPRAAGEELNRRYLLVVADFESWLRDNPSATAEERARVLDLLCSRHEAPTFDQLQASLGELEG